MYSFYRQPFLKRFVLASAPPRYCSIAQKISFSTFPPYTKITMPALSPTMEEGIISSWTKEEGDEINAGDCICEIETDKATVDFEVADDGVLAKILVGTDEKVKVGDIIGVLVEDTDHVSAFKGTTLNDFQQAQETVMKKEEKKEEKREEKVEEKVKDDVRSEGDRIFISPYALKIAKEKGCEDLEIFRGLGSGYKGRVKAADVINYYETQAPQPRSESSSRSEVSARYDDVAVGMSVLNENLTMSKKEVPHYILNCEIDLTKVLEMKKEFEEVHEKEIPVNSFFMKAAASAMKSVPSVNATFRGSFIRYFKDCHINVFTDDSLSLVKDVNTSGLAEISTSTQSPTSDALGTFSIVNLGIYGVQSLSPIVIHGQSACLGIGAICEEIEMDGDDFIRKPVVTVTLSCDHRVVDGAVGAAWLQNFKKFLEQPSSLLL